MSKRDAEIYREAARLIYYEQQKYCCIAIEEGSVFLPRDAFHAIFAPNPLTPMYSVTWGDPWGRKGRVIALLFAAAMAETGDL